MKHSYWEGSLRTLLPDRWTLAYSRNRAWRVVNDEKVPLYSQLKQALYYKSVILGYGDGPIHRVVPSHDVAKYIKEQCASSARLKAIALRAYESVANMRGYHTWTTVSPPIFLCLAAMKSSMDAMAAVVWALLFHDLPRRLVKKTGKMELFFPSMADLQNKLREKSHAFGDQFSKLYRSPWFTKLQDARDKVIHRSASPVVHDNFGAAFDFDLGLFKDMRPGRVHVGKPRAGKERHTKRIHLDRIVKGFVVGLEKWETTVAKKLSKLAWFPSFNTDGILLGIEFNDQNLLRDGAGPSHMVTSHAEGTRFKFSFVGLHPFKKARAGKPKQTALTSP
ncbi:MAG: hypothetical protein JNJ83_00280 [Verrucomicrobiaceae bacterium]|nr:hypothetical protein [Verrucomicrobiaceae bacterium]